MTRASKKPPQPILSSLSLFDRFRLVALLTPLPILVSLVALWRSSSSSIATSAHNNEPSSWKSAVFSNSTKNDTTLDVRPLQLEGHCVSVRTRGGGDRLYTLEEVISAPTVVDTLPEEANATLRVGLVFVETPERFFTLKNGAFHLFHFLEFMIVACASLSKIPAATAPSYRVEWIYVPPMTPNEICGTAHGINCQIGKMAFQNNRLKIYGLDANDDETERARPSYRGFHPKRHNSNSSSNDNNSNKSSSDFSPLPPPHSLWNDTTRRMQHNRQMKQTADIALFIHRVSCKDLDRHNTNKLITPFLHDFPYQQWHENIWSNLFPLQQQQQQRNTIIVGYLDRQYTTRRIPDPFHEWILYYFSKHPRIEFHHFQHMEQVKPLDQLKQVAVCDVLVGVHGNGLSHQLWMRPNRYVIEIFWNSPFKYDYSTLGELMRHSYLAIFNGVPVDPIRIANHDPTLRNLSMTFEEIIYNNMNNNNNNNKSNHTADSGNGNGDGNKKKKKKKLVVRNDETGEQSHQRVKIGFYAIQNFTEKAIQELLT